MDPKIYNAASNKNLSSSDFASLESEGGRQITCGKGNTILHVAVSSGSQESVTHILSLRRNHSLVLEANNDGDAPLHIAARLGDLKVVTLLADHFKLLGVLEEGVNPFSALNAKKNTALHEAVKKGHAKVVELLLQRDKHSASLTNEAGESPLFLAMDRGYYDIARRIFERWPVCSLFGRNGMTVMHAATIRFQDSFLQNALEKCGSEILEIPDNFGWMPLHHAARIDNIFAVQHFLETNSSLACKKDSNGMTAHHIAARHGHCGTIRKLIEQRPDACELVDNRGRTALHIAAERGETGVVSLLLQTVAFVDLIDEQDQDGNTSLHIAATNCAYQTLRVLASDERIDKGVINNKGMSALDIILENETLTTLGKARIAALLGDSRAHQSLEQSYTSEQVKVSESRAMPEGETDKLEDARAAPSESVKRIRGDNEKEERPLFSYLKEASSMNLIIATIIVSATYAAAIQVPGGYDSEGMPNLKSKPEFKYFMFYNSMAFGSAVGSMITFFIDKLIPKHRIERKIMTTPDLIRYSSVFLTMMFTLFASILLLVSYGYATRAIWYSGSHDLKFSFAFHNLGFNWYKTSSFGLPGNTAYVLFWFPLSFFIISVYTQLFSLVRVFKLRLHGTRNVAFLDHVLKRRQHKA